MPNNLRKLDELNALVAALDQSRLKELNSWNSFCRELNVPREMYPALMSARPELLKLFQPRALTQKRVRPV